MWKPFAPVYLHHPRLRIYNELSAVKNMIGRRTLLTVCASAAAALAAELLPGKALAIDGEAALPMRAVPEDFRKRAAELGYNLDGLWKTFHQLQSSYESRNLSTLWEVSSAPLLIIDEDRRTEVTSLQDLNKFRNLVFSDKIRNVVMGCRFPSLFLNSEGAMIGDGEVWIKDICLNPACTRSKFAIATIDKFKD
ncbi:MAG: hypothetical protein WBX25_33255 [Rhodomicrobium sp.]